MRLLLALLILLTGPAFAQTVTDPTQIALVCAYNSAVPAPTSGQYAFVQCDSTGKIITSGGTPAGSSGQLQYNNTGVFGGSILWQGTNIIEQRNGVNAQSFYTYKTYTDVNNYERINLGYLANLGVYGLTNNILGSGVGFGLYFGTSTVNPAYFITNGIARWQIDGSAGHLIAATDNTVDIGQSGSLRPRNAYLSGSITTGSTTLHTSSVALTDGAGASAGTLTNAPAVGNPTKWIPINDNGTTRYIPSW